MSGSKHQLRLQLNIPSQHDYGAWVRHAGVEDACDRLALWSVQGGRLWLSSEYAAGKSNLLGTLAAEYASMAWLEVVDQCEENSWQLAQQWEKCMAEKPRWLIDVPAGAMSVAFAHALFHLLERGRDQQRSIVIAWRGDAHSLPPELSSRLLAMEKVCMSPPASDVDLLQVLRSSAGDLQWDIREQVLQSMLIYLPRQLDVLVAALNELETLSFEQKHKPGPAWVKQQLMRIAEGLHPRLIG
jgi:hypothetical protein